MKGQENSMIDIWEIDHSKFSEQSEEEEIVSSGNSEVDEIPEVDEVEGEEGRQEPSEGKGDGKQTEEEVEEETPGEEDAPSAGTVESNEVDDFGNVLESLVDEGIVDFDPEKEYEKGPKGLQELIKDTVEKRRQKDREEYKNSLPEEGRKLLEILEKGGSLDDYNKMSQEIDFEKVPLVNKDGEPIERNQKNLVEDWLKEQGYDEDEIQDRIAKYKETGLLGEEAAIAKKKLAANQKKRNEDRITNLEKEKQEQIQKQTKQAEEFKEKVTNLKEVAGFKLTKDKASKLYDYITKPVKDGKTQFQIDDKEDTRLLYAYLAMSGFDKSALEKEERTKAAIKFKNKLSNYQDKEATPKRGAADVRRTKDQTDVKNIPWII